MAFGFPASFTKEFELTGSRTDAREAIKAVFDLLNWSYTELHPDLFTARVPMSGAGWGETIKIALEPPGVIRIKSSCRIFQIFDWGKNRRNVETFALRFALRESRYTKTAEAQPDQFDEEGKTPLDRALIDTTPQSVSDESDELGVRFNLSSKS